MTKYCDIPLYLRPFTQLLKKRPYPWDRDPSQESPLKKQKRDKELNLDKEAALLSRLLLYNPH